MIRQLLDFVKDCGAMRHDALDRRRRHPTGGGRRGCATSVAVAHTLRLRAAPPDGRAAIDIPVAKGEAMHRSRHCQRTLFGLLLGGLGACASAGSRTDLGSELGKDVAASAQSDERTLAILHRSDVGEISAGMVAQERATDPAVKAFAVMMVSEHTKLDEQGNRLAQQINAAATLPDSTLQGILSADSAALRLTAEPAAFDRTYIAQQVAAHQRTLDVIDVGLKNSTHAEVKTALESQVRPAVARHLAMARQIQGRLSGSTASRGVTSGTSAGSVTESTTDSSAAPKKP
jgi:putative membrane protein